MTVQWYELALHVEDVRPFVVRRFQTEDEDLFGLVGCHLCLGDRIQDWNAHSWIRSKHRKYEGVPDDILAEHLNVPTFSHRLREALERAGVGRKDVQYLPIHVLKSTGEELEGYAFANVITRIKALDYDRTDWGPLPPDPEEGIDPATGKLKVNGIWRAALIEAKLKGHDLVRLVEFFPPVYVSERFADVFRDGNFTGATLAPAIMT